MVKKSTIKTERGDIRIEFFDEDAPNTVKNFIDLIQDGFYNGLNFRICYGRCLKRGLKSIGKTQQEVN